jgi:YD repeat-containing protein
MRFHEAARPGQDAEGRVTRYDYDSTPPDQANKITVDYGGAGHLNLATQYGYNNSGDVTSVTDANGHIATSQFDNLRRVAEVDGAVAGTVKKYTYYPNGQVKTVARQIATNSFETTQYTYTFSDKVSQVTDPLGNTSTTTYDADDRVQTVTQQVSASQNRQRDYNLRCTKPVASGQRHDRG